MQIEANGFWDAYGTKAEFGISKLQKAEGREFRIIDTAIQNEHKPNDRVLWGTRKLAGEDYYNMQEGIRWLRSYGVSNGRFPDSHFPGQAFPIQDISPMITFPDRRFPDNLYK